MAVLLVLLHRCVLRACSSWPQTASSCGCVVLQVLVCCCLIEWLSGC